MRSVLRDACMIFLKYGDVQVRARFIRWVGMAAQYKIDISET